MLFPARVISGLCVIDQTSLILVGVIRKLCAVEQADGHKVWIDIDGMGGSTLEAMAGAVENAKVVLMCLSEQYKLSENCRSGKY